MKNVHAKFDLKQVSKVPYKVSQSDPEFTQFSTRYDPETSSIWCWLRPEPRPCLNATLVDEMMLLQQQLTTTYKEQGPDTIWPFQHLILASQLPGVYSLGGDLELFKQCIENKDEENKMEKIMSIIKAIRNIKSDMNIPYNKKIDLYLNIHEQDKLKLIEENTHYIKTMIKTKSLELGKGIKKPEYSATAVLEGVEIFIPLKGIINISEEIDRLEKKLNKINNELNVIFKKINNEDFLSRAPEDIVNKERDKANNLRDIKKRLENNLKSFK